MPLRIWGGTVAAPNTTADPAAAEARARAVLAAHVDLLAPGASPSDFVLASNHLDRGVRTVGFTQTWRGLPVVGGQLGFVFSHDHLFAIGSEALPNVSAAMPSTRATTQRARAEAWIAGETGRIAKTRATRPRAVLPIVFGPGDIEYHVADLFDVETPAAPGRWNVYVAADGTPLARESTIMTMTSTLDYNVGLRYATGERADMPAPTVNLTANAVATTTAVDGTFTWTGTGAATVVPTCTSTTVNIMNQAGSAATTSFDANPGDTLVWNVSNVELDDSQVSTYIYGNIAAARDRLINPAIASTFLAGPLPFYVNENGTCNAFSTGDEVHLYRADSTCQNSGRIADVVFHEFGHSVHKHSIIPGMGVFDQSLSEGLADFNAANITEDSGVGRGFYYTDAPMRDIDPPGVEKSYPADVNSDPHITGEIISGALWDLRKALVLELGHDAGVTQTEKIFTGVMQRAADIPSSYLAAQIADDDDGDLGNGTPHQCELERAFGVHGLVDGFVNTTVASPVLDGLAMSVAVTTPTGTDCPPLQVVGMSVLWNVGDSVASSFTLADRGDGTWLGAFAPVPDGTIVTYSLDVTFDDNSTLEFPNNPADPAYQAFVGTATPIYCEMFDHDPMWMQTGNLSDEWEFGMPNPVAALTGDPLAAHTGTNIYGTNVYDGGAYRPDEVTSTQTSAIDVSAYQIIHLQYWRWLTVEDATYDQATISVNGAQLWENASNASGTLDHVDREWRFHDIELTPYITDGTATVQWQLQSDPSIELGGWTIDDVCIVGMAKIPKCGDGVLDPGEQCDDGNTNSGDGCSQTCGDELSASGGGCAATGGGGGWLAGISAVALALVRGRGRRDRSRRASRSTRSGRADPTTPSA